MTNRLVLKRSLLLRSAALLAAAAMFGCSSGDSAEAAGGAPPGVLDLETFLTNISDPLGERYCKLTVKLAVSPPEAVEEIKGDSLLVARIRDKILTLVTSKTALDLNDPEGKEVFREEIRAGVSELIGTAKVDQVLFAEFVVQ